jgi:hypothetical protein
VFLQVGQRLGRVGDVLDRRFGAVSR